MTHPDIFRVIRLFIDEEANSGVQKSRADNNEKAPPRRMYYVNKDILISTMKRILIEKQITVNAYMGSLVTFFNLTRKKIKGDDEFSDSNALSNDSGSDREYFSDSEPETVANN